MKTSRSTFYLWDFQKINKKNWRSTAYSKSNEWLNINCFTYGVAIDYGHKKWLYEHSGVNGKERKAENENNKNQ